MRANNDGTQECGVAITLQPGRADQDVISKGQEKIGQIGLRPGQGEISRLQQGCNLRPIVWCCTAHDPGTHRCSSSTRWDGCCFCGLRLEGLVKPRKCMCHLLTFCRWDTSHHPFSMGIERLVQLLRARLACWRQRDPNSASVGVPQRFGQQAFLDERLHGTTEPALI